MKGQLKQHKGETGKKEEGKTNNAMEEQIDTKH